MTTLIGTTLSGTERHIDDRTIHDLAQDLSRPPILPGSAGYDEARRVFNKMIDKRPALIVQCGGVADVLRAVRFARDHDLILAVRGGAHNAAGFATCDGGIVIDLSPMRAVRVDVDNRLVRVEGGLEAVVEDGAARADGLGFELTTSHGRAAFVVGLVEDRRVFTGAGSLQLPFPGEDAPGREL